MLPKVMCEFFLSFPFFSQTSFIYTSMIERGCC
ncbi:hypothetical protein OIU79_007029 [Salix purpurea]|uniref:Uncharacterized protein n=1 Tax=Salix purpurea TaxID=77065 RepID=A0A9Q0TWU0_SALPP|nr:hypothetical protein OIU79_007029 [Salix purpurea]